PVVNVGGPQRYPLAGPQRYPPGVPPGLNGPSRPSSVKPTPATLEVPLAVRGELWSHKLDAAYAGETYELDKAPADMKISADGTLTWQVPPRYSASADVQLYSTNADQKRLIKFKLNAGKRTKDGVVAVERLPKMS